MLFYGVFLTIDWWLNSLGLSISISIEIYVNLTCSEHNPLITTLKDSEVVN